MQFSLILNRLVVPRCSTWTKQVSASRRKCSETVDWPTSTPATISPTVMGRRSVANRLKILDARGVGQAPEPCCEQLSPVPLNNHRLVTIADREQLVATLSPNWAIGHPVRRGGLLGLFTTFPLVGLGAGGALPPLTDAAGSRRLPTKQW